MQYNYDNYLYNLLEVAKKYQILKYFSTEEDCTYWLVDLLNSDLLSDRDKFVFYKRFVENCTYVSIAHDLSVGVPTVSKVLQRVEYKIKRELVLQRGLVDGIKF